MRDAGRPPENLEPAVRTLIEGAGHSSRKRTESADLTDYRVYKCSRLAA